MQIAWEMPSTVSSHSRLPSDSRSTRRAFSSAMAAWAAAAPSSSRSSAPNAPARSAPSEMAPMARPAAMRGAPIQAAGAAGPGSIPMSATAARTSRGTTRGPRRRASCTKGSSVRPVTVPARWATVSWFDRTSSKTISIRSGVSSSVSRAASRSTIMAGRNEPASSCANAVSRGRARGRAVGRGPDIRRQTSDNSP